MLLRNIVRHLYYRVQRLLQRNVSAAILERLDCNLGWNIADHFVLRKWTAAKPTDGGVKTAAARFIGSDDLFCGACARAVQVCADLQVVICFGHGGNQLFYLRWR